jgi:uncharacterized protein with von Willebrand factor type A (vWA) domain
MKCQIHEPSMLVITFIVISILYAGIMSCSKTNNDAKKLEEIRQLREYVDQRFASIDSSLVIISQRTDVDKKNISILFSNLRDLIDQLNEHR